jgi:hypothetical protein
MIVRKRRPIRVAAKDIRRLGYQEAVKRALIKAALKKPPQKRKCSYV